MMNQSIDAKIENKTTASSFNSSELNLSPMDKDKKLNRPLKKSITWPLQKSLPLLKAKEGFFFFYLVKIYP